MVVVGGYLQLGSSSDTSSVEILDDGAVAWRNGPSSPVTLSSAAMVPDDQGGVILIGGYSGGLLQVLNTLFRLRHAAAQWELMPQRLKTTRFLPLAFLIPDNITNCTWL